MNILQAKETKQFIFKCHSHDMLDCLSPVCVCVCVGGKIKLYIQLQEVGEVAKRERKGERERKSETGASQAQSNRSA